MRIGLTGGIACGKSTAARACAAAGARVLDTDQVAKDLYRDDPEVREALAGRWGPAVFGPGGELDRARVAGIVFGQPAELAWLEALVHPRVRVRWQARLDAEPDALWVVEIPLLFEKSLESAFDFVVCVEAGRAQQLARLAARGLSETEALARLARQAPLAEKVRRARHVLSGRGAPAFLARQTAVLLASLSDPAPPAQPFLSAAPRGSEPTA